MVTLLVMISSVFYIFNSSLFKGLPYDVGHGQRLFLSCKGKGTPTVVMESPIGFNSDFWLPLQLKLSDLTKVKKFLFNHFISSSRSMI